MTEMVLFHFTDRVGPWRVQLHKRHGQEPHHQRHVHISRKGLRGEYSWNEDGTRHDSHRFPKSEQQIARAKRLAADALKVQESLLQLIIKVDGSSHVSMSEVHNVGRHRRLLSLYVRSSEHLVLLGAEDGLIFIVSDEAK